MSKILKLTELRKLMLEMEKSLGLQELSEVERDILCAASEIAQTELSDYASTSHLMNHTLVSGVSRPTFFRALSSLVKKGHLSKNEEDSRGYYSVTNFSR